MAKPSKPIRTTDESAQRLLAELAACGVPETPQLHSYYRVRGKYVLLDFVEVPNALESYELSEAWPDLSARILLLHDFTRRAEGALWLVVHTRDRQRFRICDVARATSTALDLARERWLDWPGFCSWLQRLNAEALAT